jgi:hypothetical protein
VLAVGCGPGLAGRTAGFAAEVVREVLPHAAVEQVNYTHGAPAPGNTYDLVVTHSLLHFALDLDALGEFLLAAVPPGGWYVMGNEPNARFWANRECLLALEEVDEAESRRNQMRKLADPARYLLRLRRALNPRPAPDTTAGVNRLLRDRLGMTGELTAKEIVRIVDPHLPDEMPGEYRLGSPGLHWTALATGPLADMTLETVRTSGYVMRDNPAQVPERWRKLDERLKRRFPRDGRSFSALWQRRTA